MPQPKTITMFLIDGDVVGRVKCSLANWTGVAYKIPRIDLEKCNDLAPLKQSGVYFLFGYSDKDMPRVYIGQASSRKNGEGVLARIKEHHKKKDFWSEVIILTTSNDSLGATEISYLENRFYNLANEIGRYDTENSNDPNPSNITEEKQAEMDEFFDCAKVLIGVLGHRLFEPTSKAAPETAQNLLYLKRNIKGFGEVSATCQQTAEGFVVLKGSVISPNSADHISEPLKNRRKNAHIVNNILQKDEIFSSASYAAIFVVGKSCSGNEAWHYENGAKLKTNS